MKYTLEQCIEQQKKVDASIKHNGEYMPWLAGVKEVIEMCDHLSMIDTWKKQPLPDNKQAFMEAVDVFAFILSNIIKEGRGDEKRVLGEPRVCFDDCNSDDVLFRCLISYIADEDFSNAIETLVFICNKIFKRGLEDICYYYMGKQALTQFRQANGYKTGDYIKNWAGKEDNEHLTEMLEKGVSIEYLPTALEDAYSLVIKHA